MSNIVKSYVFWASIGVRFTFLDIILSDESWVIKKILRCFWCHQIIHICQMVISSKDLTLTIEIFYLKPLCTQCYKDLNSPFSFLAYCDKHAFVTIKSFYSMSRCTLRYYLSYPRMMNLFFKIPNLCKCSAFVQPYRNWHPNF